MLLLSNIDFKITVINSQGGRILAENLKNQMEILELKINI